MAEVLRCEKCRDEVATLIRAPSISEVGQEWPDGLCPRCYETVTGTPAPKRVPKVVEAEARKKRKYTRRQPAALPVVKEIGKGILPERKVPEREPAPTTIGRIEKIRLGYIDQRKKTEQMLVDLDLKIETATEIIEAVR